MPKHHSPDSRAKTQSGGKDKTSQSCWQGYKKAGSHMSNGNRVNTCIKKK